MGNNVNEPVLPQAVPLPIEIPDKKLDSPPDLSKWPVFSNSVVGTWVNVDPDSTGIVKIIVKYDAQHRKFTVHPYIGSLSRPHDLGSHPAIVYGDEVSAKEPRAFTATLSEFLSKTLITGHFEYGPPWECVRREVLVVEAYAQGFRHPSYYSREIFRRA